MVAGFRLASFNLESLDEDGPGGLDLEARADLLRPQLLRLRADILCLQEVNAQPSAAGARSLRALDRLLEGTLYAAFHRAVTTNVKRIGPSDKHNLVVLSRWPLVGAHEYRHDLVPPCLYAPVTARGDAAAGAQPVHFERPVQHVEVALSDSDRLHVFNLHLRSRLASLIAGQKIGPFAWESGAAWAEGAFLSAIKRSGQALEARLAIERVFEYNPHALIAVIGDFNAEADEVPVEILRADTDNTGNPKLAGRVLAVLEPQDGAATTVSMVHHGRAMRLDHMLVSRALLAWLATIEVHNELLHDESIALAARTAFPESYHAPIVASFTRPGLAGVDDR